MSKISDLPEVTSLNDAAFLPIVQDGVTKRVTAAQLQAFVGSAPTGPFNPLTQVAAMHGVWLGDPLWGDPGDGNAIPSLRNQSGGGDPASSGSARPLFVLATASMGGRPTALYDGVDDVSAVTVASVSVPFKWLVAFALNSVAPTKNIFGTSYTGAAGPGFHTADLTPDVFRASAGVNLPTSHTLDTLAHVARGTIDGASSEVWIDGVSVATGDAGTHAWTVWKLGAGGSGTALANHANVNIGFNALYDPGTPDGDLEELEADLMTHYAV